MKTDHKTTTKCTNFFQRFFPCFLQNKAETQEIQELNLQIICFHVLYRICLFSYSSQNLLFHIVQRICLSILFTEYVCFHIQVTESDCFYIQVTESVSFLYSSFKESICFHILHRIWLFPYSSENLSVFKAFRESIYLSICLSVFKAFRESIYLSICFHILHRICFLAGSL